MTLVIDASVAIKWITAESDSPRARALIGSEPLIAPDFLLVECANVLTMKARRGEIDADDVDSNVKGLEALPLLLLPTRGLVGSAIVIAQTLRQSIYDSLYLSLAVAENATLVTSDGRFARAASTAPKYAHFVRTL